MTAFSEMDRAMLALNVVRHIAERRQLEFTVADDLTFSTTLETGHVLHFDNDGGWILTVSNLHRPRVDADVPTKLFTIQTRGDETPNTVLALIDVAIELAQEDLDGESIITVYGPGGRADLVLPLVRDDLMNGFESAEASLFGGRWAWWLSE